MTMAMGMHVNSVDTLEVFKDHATAALRPTLEDGLRTTQAHAAGRSVSAYRFSREDWEQARFEELVYAQHERQIRETSYLSVPAPIFRVH